MEKLIYRFKRYTPLGSRVLECPNCMESLERQDIEDYSNCPYCLTSLPFNYDLEDYLLDPLVEIWQAQEQSQNKTIEELTDSVATFVI